jgi:23S rRNA (uracil1939-C5)-methyltransferase
VELEIDGLAAGGRGVARAGGVVWFVAGALPGDRVLAEPRRRKPRFVEARVLERLRASPDRRAAPCPLQPICGGCPWMPLDEAEQRKWKRTVVADALRRLGRSAVAVEPTLASPRALGYRNKVEFTLGPDGRGRPSVGLYAADPDHRGRLVDVDRCPVQTDAANAVLATAREFLLARSDAWLDPGERADRFRLVIRSASREGPVLVALRETTRPFPHAEALARALGDAHPEVVGIVRLRARTGQRGGTRTLPLMGRSWIEEHVGAMAFRLPAASFLQVNSEAGGLLLELVRRGAGPVKGRVAIDLYAGVGAFGIDLARRGADVTACDADLDAVRCGRRAARGSATGRIAFRHGDSAAFLRALLARGHRANIVVANPPRSGLGARVPDQIADLEAERVVLVSCDPATLARDTRRLESRGFVAERAVPVDVFPQTAHVETVLTLARR